MTDPDDRPAADPDEVERHLTELRELLVELAEVSHRDFVLGSNHTH